MMNAAIHRIYGGSEVVTVEKTELPVLGKGQLLVKVFASTVNRTDCARLTAKPFLMRFMTGLFRPNNPIPGTDFSGTVSAIGPAVTNFKKGDKIFGFNDNGLSSHAEYLVIASSKNVLQMPQQISFEQAVASIEGFHYALNFVNKVDLKKGQTVLVNGATGAIGSAALQLLVHYGAIVTAVGNTENLQLLQSLGAAKVVDYTKEDFTKLEESFDYVFDTVGKSTFGKCKHLLKPKGIYISSELGWGAQNLFYSLWTPWLGGRKVGFPFPHKIRESLALAKQLLENGEFQPVIDKVYPLDDVAAAFAYVLTGQKTGNVVLTIQN